MAPRVVVAGFGDTGLCAATRLAADTSCSVEVVGITPKPCHHSMQELGGRLAQPSLWQQLYLLPFGAYRQLDNTRVVQGVVTSIDLVSLRAPALRLHRAAPTSTTKRLAARSPPPSAHIVAHTGSCAWWQEAGVAGVAFQHLL